MLDELISRYPELGAIVLILLGFLLGGLLSRVVVQLLHWFNNWVRKTLPALTLASVRTEIIVQKAVYYLTVGVSVLFALRLLGFEEFSGLLDQAIVFIPGLISGAVIILVGYLVSVFVYQVLMASRWTGDNPMVPRLAQGVVITVVVLTGLSQMSVDVSLIGQTLIVLLLVTMGGMALAFALGSGNYVSNVLARRSFRDFAVGDRVRLDEIEGTIVEFRQTSVMIQTEEGVAVVPAHIFADSVVTRLIS